MHLSALLQFTLSLSALLENINLFFKEIKLHTLKYAGITLYADIFDADLAATS